MLTTLKDIFRPTRTKIVLTPILAIPLVSLGILLSGRHPTEFAESLRATLGLGGTLVGLLPPWALPGWLAFILAWVLDFLWYYIAICILSFGLSFVVRKKQAKSIERGGTST